MMELILLCIIICYLLFVICYLLFVICYLLFVICYLILIFPSFCFAKSVQLTEDEVFRNVLISKESMYVNTRNALKKIAQLEKTVTTIEHH